eukprot:TRINITY_DN10334_c0_g1_i1.p1 TRINITY_DN10334_c0_g1~~TRINITY_DN10334_c0_g1_i1.p1  ORF type:complete len:131 (+),score=28.23 TRINITY_DN10334_c0_g1_i1:37-393(+)
MSKTSGVANPNYKPMPINQNGYKTFEEFYPFYLGEHNHQINRRLHLTGTSIAILTLIYAVLTFNFLLLPLAIVIGYAFSWTGHFFFEKNKPATFKYPIFSLKGDFRMLKEVVTLQRPF